MTNFIRGIQEKPHYVRVQILWISVIVFMIAVIALWTTVFSDFGPALAEGKKAEEEEGLPGFWKSLSNSFGILKEEITSQKNEMDKNLKTNGIFDENWSGGKLPN